ncbi:MAG TPA: polyprenyl synthetase family protein [Verrucomicrobiae bacterium]|nr:polyprenyl synthetase family protein [Verrucomicrobiae bacterium]
MSTKNTAKSDKKVFATKLSAYKKLLDADIAAYTKTVEKSTLQQYGSQARLATDAYLSLLGRGGKRIRGALTMVGYEMSGGRDQKMIVQAARAIEMMHAYILIIDDIQDRSLTRRGGPTAHMQLADYHRKHQLADDPDHFGISLALNSALLAGHMANTILANLPGATENARLKAVSIMNDTMATTAHGQTNDIMNEVVDTVDLQQVDDVLKWKTAHYTFLNPLYIGMVLAGAGDDATDAITDYAMSAGRAFQITDDILGVFGTEFDSGKSPLDDIREGKRTVLTVYALEHTQNANKNFLIHMLGNQKLTPAEFRRCKDILVDCGALVYAKEVAADHVQAALVALDAVRGSAEGKRFLRGLAEYLLVRTS